MTDEIIQENNSMTQQNLKFIPIDQLMPHPKNPRLFMRDEVIDGLVAGLKDGFKVKHALHVRPIENAYQVISGHHRLEASKKIGLTELPCWIEDMDDDTAYMELVKANNQGELLPLEVGIHALEKVGKAQGKKGQGLAAYAEAMGRNVKNIERYANAAKVYQSLPTTLSEVMDKTQHLYEISKAPEDAWGVLVSGLIECEWSVKETKAVVDRIKSVVFFDWMAIDKEPLYQTIMMKPAESNKMKQALNGIEAYLDKLADKATVYYLIKTNDIVQIDGRDFYQLLPEPETVCPKQMFIDLIQEKENYFDLKTIQSIFQGLLHDLDRMSLSKVEYEPVMTDEELKAHQQRQREIEILEKRNRLMPVMKQGDVLTELSKLTNASVDLICIDPPYNMDKADWDSFGSGRKFAEWCHPWLKECFRVLKPEGAIYVFGINRMLSHIQHRMDEIGFYYRNWITWDTIQGAGGGLWVNRHEDILYYSKTDQTFEDNDAIKLERSEENIREYKGKEYQFKNPSNVWRFPCVDNQHEDRTDHPTQKPVELIERIVKASCPEGGLVLDCFMGSGTTGVAAMKNNRRSIGIEINPEYITIAESRFEDVDLM